VLRLWLAYILLACLWTGSAIAQPSQPERPGQVDFIKRALFAEGRLWVLSDDGVLASISPTADKRELSPTTGKTLDICNLAGRIAFVAATESGHRQWAVYEHRTDGSWSIAAAVPQEGDRLIGLACRADAGVLLTNKRLVELRHDGAGLARTTEVRLEGAPRGGLIASLMRREPNTLWLGIDAGEWGGGLMRIDTRTGKVAAVEENSTGELCGGPINSACDPVNGIEQEPWKPECLVVAIGLDHMLAKGRLVEVCPKSIRTLAELPLGDRVGRDGQPLDTVPFFGLAPAGDALWAVGVDGLYRITDKRTAKIGSFPVFNNVGGVYVNFDDPHFVLVLSEINRRASVSGRTPMIVAR
jgi:hypothetical protein